MTHLQERALEGDRRAAIEIAKSIKEKDNKLL